MADFELDFVGPGARRSLQAAVRAETAAAAAALSEAAAETAATSAENAADLAAGALTQTITLAGTYATKAAAAAALGAIAADAYVQVLADESQGGRRTLYRKTGGALVLAHDFGIANLARALIEALSGTGTTSVYGQKIVPGAGDNDIALLLEGLGRGQNLVRLHGLDGMDMVEFREFEDMGGGVYEDRGPTIVIGGGYDSNKWISIATNYIDNGYDKDDPRYRRFFIYSGDRRNDNGGAILTWADIAQLRREPSICHLEADVISALSLTGWNAAGGYTLTVRGNVPSGKNGKILTAIDNVGDFHFGPGFYLEPRAGEPGEEVNDCQLGRIGDDLFGMKKGAWRFAEYLVATVPDPTSVGDGVVVNITDAPTPGPHVTSAGAWKPLSLGAAVTMPGFGWTTLTSGSGTTTEGSNKSFDKTAGGDDWNALVYSSESITGDQRVSFNVADVTNAPILYVGLMAATTTPGGDLYDEIKFGVYHQAALFFGVDDSVTNYDAPVWTGLTVGDLVRLDLDASAGTLTLTVGDGTPVVVATGVPNVAYKVAAGFWRQGGAIDNLRHLAT